MRLATMSAGCGFLPSASATLRSSSALPAATARSFSIRSAGTSDAWMATGFMAAMCIATSLAEVSSPSNSTITPMRVPCRYDASLPLPAKCLKRRKLMFSPILPIRPLRTSSSVGPKPSCS
ncbi:hypothetical protein FQZ97_1145890 [compost metagenome]